MGDDLYTPPVQDFRSKSAVLFCGRNTHSLSHIQSHPSSLTRIHILSVSITFTPSHTLSRPPLHASTYSLSQSPSLPLTHSHVPPYTHPHTLCPNHLHSLSQTRKNYRFRIQDSGFSSAYSACEDTV